MKVKALILLLLSLSLSLSAFHSEDFVLGTYSYLQNGNAFFRENRAQIIREMKALGYNMTIVETNNSDKDLNSLLKDLDAAGIDVVLTDKCWSNDPNDPKHYSVVALATSNYYRFEAEFTDARDVKAGDGQDHRYWYGNSDTVARTGRVYKDPGASYEHAWFASRQRDQKGWLYTDVNYRYKDRKGNTVKLYDEIRFHKTHQEAKADQDSLYLTYRVKLSNFASDLQPESPVLSMEFYGHAGDKHSFGTKQEVRLSQAGSKQSQSPFSYADYQKLGSPTEFFDLHLNISYNDLRQSGLMTDDLDNNPASSAHWWWYVLRHFAPGLYWHGNCDVSLDYIEFEDQIHRDLRLHTAAYRKGINARIQEHLDLPNGHIIKHMYSMDEPFQTQLHSFQLIQGLIDPGKPSLLAASYDIDHREFAQSGKDKYWEFQTLTRAIAQPQDIMPDIYPIRPKVNYDPYAGEYFLQNVLDHQLGRYYRESKNYSQSNGHFYPIVQTFGYWSGQQWYSWTLPPQATQRALLLLPFCYGADGMYHYQLQGAVSSVNNSGYLAPLIGIDSKHIEPVPYSYEIIDELNPRIKRIGKELSNWQWQDATTVMIGKNYPAVDFAATPIRKLRVKQACNGLYEGYIETGIYHNEQGETALFAVNRRSNYFVYRAKHRHPDYTPLDKYSKAYEEFEAQTLVIYLAKDQYKAQVIDLESGKSYPVKNGKVQIKLAAGEGKLLKIAP